MTVCPACEASARTGEYGGEFLRGNACCDARWLMLLPERYRRSAAAGVKAARPPAEWAAIKARLDVLIAAEARDA